MTSPEHLNWSSEKLNCYHVVILSEQNQSKPLRFPEYALPIWSVAMRFTAPAATVVIFFALVLSVMLDRSFAEGGVERANVQPDKVMIISYSLTGLPVTVAGRRNV